MKTSTFLAVALACIVSVQAVPTGSASVLEARGTSPIGTSCSTSTSCTDGLFCNRKKCDSKKIDGEACYKDVGCVNNACSANKICLAATNRGLTVQCTASTQCASGYCGQSKCASKLADGGACYKNSGCLGGKCTSGKCGTGSQAQLLPIKAQCTTSVSCASGLCEHGKCATKKANGKACYKDIACISGYCKNGKICAAAPSATTTAPVATPVATPVLKDGSFSSGNLNDYAVTGDVTAIQSADCLTDGSCAQLGVPSGGEASLLQTLTTAAKVKRQQGSNVSIWGVNYYYKIKSFTATTSGAGCRVYTKINDDERTLGASVISMPNPSGWIKQYAETQSTYITRTGAEVQCDPGATMTMLLDNLQVINLPDYLSSSKAGLNPPGISTPPGVTAEGTATLTGPGSITTTAPTATPVSARDLILTDGSFNSGNLDAWQIKTNVQAFVSDTCFTGGHCAKMTVPDNGTATLQQTLTKVQRRALQRRQAPTWVSNYWLHVIDFQSVNASDYAHVCRTYDLIDGIRTSFNTISYTEDIGWWHSGGSDFGSTIESIGFEIVCDPGATTTVLIDDVQYLNTIEFQSSYSAGLNPTGFVQSPT